MTDTIETRNETFDEAVANAATDGKPTEHATLPFQHVDEAGEEAFLTVRNLIAREVNSGYWTLMKLIRQHDEIEALPYVSDEEDLPNEKFFHDLGLLINYLAKLHRAVDLLDELGCMLPTVKAAHERMHAEGMSALAAMTERMQAEMAAVGMKVSVLTPEGWDGK